MPKAKLHKGHRQTRCPKTGINLRKENGRPRETYKRYRFEETRLGFFLKYEVPVVFDILMNLTPLGIWFEPPYLLVKKVCEASSDASLCKPKFQRYLEQYKLDGLYCHKAMILTPRKEAYYQGIRQKKMQRFITRNRGKIDALRINISKPPAPNTK